MQGSRHRNDRRKKSRFEIMRELRYKVADNGLVVACGNGQTSNIGSGGVAFATEQPLTPGAFVELSISWPALLDEVLPMRLVVFGRVLRSNGTNAACTIDKHEFRTQARTTAPVSAVRSDGVLRRRADGIRKQTLKTSLAGA